MAACLFSLGIGQAGAVCPVGDTLSQGSCPPGTTLAGCCASEGVVQWCENGDWCQLDCTQNESNTSCTPNWDSCCQRCGNYDASYNCQCDEVCVQYSDCCGDLNLYCGADGAPQGGATSCGWKETGTFSGYDCSPSMLGDPTGVNPLMCGGTGPCSCLGKQCGDDGCGNICGFCPAGSSCDPFGACGCAASCSGKWCGDDGCGGSCGTCPGGHQCVNGNCLQSCVPDCAGKQCGADGCGASCGTCVGGSACNGAGLCEAPCQPTCAGKQCGGDGCGGTCGTCPADLYCNMVAGQCVSDCTGNCLGKVCGDDGCGGSCGVCGGGLVCDPTGLCVSSCVPACAGKVCGDDGCGSSCGQCAAGLGCDGAGQCASTCEASCLGKQCGGDGCGGTCGVCAGGSCQDGICLVGCEGDCTTKTCGDDGCGGSCGDCAPGYGCGDDGKCAGGCVPDCVNLACGDDGCGGSCGTCAVGTSCDAFGQCAGYPGSDVPLAGPGQGCPPGTYWNAWAAECVADDGSHIPTEAASESVSGCGAAPPGGGWTWILLAGLGFVGLVRHKRRQTSP